MGNKKRIKIKKLLNRLYKLHEYYLTLDNTGKVKVAETCEPIFIKLERLGINRNFSETLLVYGDEFLKEEFNLVRSDLF